MATDGERTAMGERANGLSKELIDAVQRADWDQVFLISQELQRVADALSN